MLDQLARPRVHAQKSTKSGEIVLGVRHVGRSFLANDGNSSLTVPAHSLVDVGFGIPILGTLIRIQVQNALDATAYHGGYTDGATRYFFPVAARTILATAIVAF